MAILNDDVNQLERFLDGGANELIQVATTVDRDRRGVLPRSRRGWPGWRCCPMPFVLWGSFALPAAARAALRGRARAASGSSTRELANNLGGIATIKSFTAEEHEVARIGARERRLPRRATARAIRLSVGLLAADPHGDRRRLHRRRSSIGGGCALDGTLAVGRLQRDGVPDAAPAVAAHAPRRDLRPLPARDGVDARASSTCSTRAPAHPERRGALPDGASAARSSFERRALRLPTRGTPVLRDVSLTIPAGRDDGDRRPDRRRARARS